MAEPSSQNPSSPNITLKEEPDTQERLESLNPFLPADWLNSHLMKSLFPPTMRAPNQYVKYLAEFWYTAKTLEGSKIWVSTPTGKIGGEIGITTFRNALRAHYLPHSSRYVTPPSLSVVRPWFATIGYSGEIGAKGIFKNSFLPPRLIWEDIIHKMNKKSKEKVIPYLKFISLLLKYMMPEYDQENLTINSTQVFSVHNWALKANQPKGPSFADHMKDICNIDVLVESQAPKTSSKAEMKVPQGKKPGARSGLGRKQSSKHTSESKTKASKSKTGQSDKETQYSSAKEKIPSHHLPSKPVVDEMHKEAQQAAGGPTSLRAISEKGAHPQLSSGMSAFILIEPIYSASFIFTLSLHQDGMDEGTKNYAIDHIFVRTNPSVLIDKIKSARDGLKTAHTDLGTNEESRFDEITKKIKLEDLSDESEEEETKRYEDTHTTSHDGPEDTSIPYPLSPKLVQIKELMAQVHLLQSQKDELEQQKAKAEAEVASLKARP
ncbi:hypothetical protein Tco_0988154 [Tanacetum coccineum]|uniref:Uncharacterized protein n=1 Tax=Tanacetum coccineum TaxID=301880 RepID=A0ABQ5EQC8_9ASTR